MKKIMIITAHAGDFIWRAGGVVAKYIRQGYNVKVLSLTLGVNGEANSFWKNSPHASISECKEIRMKEILCSAAILGLSDVKIYDINDYIIPNTKEICDIIENEVSGYMPDIVLTHDYENDLFNPDHNIIAGMVDSVCRDNSVRTAIPVYGFEPHDSDFCHFRPVIYIDISDVIDVKNKAMIEVATQNNMAEYYMCKARIRGFQASAFGKINCQYAEAFSKFGPISSQGELIW